MRPSRVSSKTLGILRLLEIQMIARACGKADVHDLEPEDLASLTVEAAAITAIPLVGTFDPPDGAGLARDRGEPARWVPGRGRD